MKVRNVNPLGSVIVPALRMEPVKAGEVVEVDDELGASLLEQVGNWEAAETRSSRPLRPVAAEVSPEPDPGDAA